MWVAAVLLALAAPRPNIVDVIATVDINEITHKNYTDKPTYNNHTNVINDNNTNVKTSEAEYRDIDSLSVDSRLVLGDVQPDSTTTNPPVLANDLDFFSGANKDDALKVDIYTNNDVEVHTNGNIELNAEDLVWDDDVYEPYIEDMSYELEEYIESIMTLPETPEQRTKVALVLLDAAKFLLDPKE